MQDAMTLRKEGLKYENLSEKDRSEADKGAWHIKVAIAMGVLVVLCFLTECIPLPGVAFCTGVALTGPTPHPTPGSGASLAPCVVFGFLETFRSQSDTVTASMSTALPSSRSDHINITPFTNCKTY
jgi:hypothetical protein